MVIPVPDSCVVAVVAPLPVVNTFTLAPAMPLWCLCNESPGVHIGALAITTTTTVAASAGVAPPGPTPPLVALHYHIFIGSTCDMSGRIQAFPGSVCSG
jgi:hypothetical protein